jgi:hypothetical protein
MTGPQRSGGGVTAEAPLREGLRALAGQAPPAAVPADFFDRVHRRTRQRRAVRAAAAVVALLTVGVGLALRPGSDGGQAPGGPEAVTTGLPRSLRVPPIWTALVEQSLPGPAAMIFGGPATTDDWNEGRIGVVAAGSDRYRVFNEFLYTAPGFDALLSPDGGLVARNRTVRSLRPDRPVSITLPGDPRAFSPDGTRLAFETGDGTTNIDGVEHRESRVGVYDLAAGREVASIDNTDNLHSVVVAFSPDNSRLAIQVRDEIRLYRLDGPDRAPYATVRLGAEMLAGPGAWRPDGRTFVTARHDAGGTWRLAAHDAATGEARPDVAALPAAPGVRYVRVVGWRPDGTAVAVAGVPRFGAAPFDEQRRMVYPDGDTARVRLIALAPGAAGPAVLLESPDGVSDIDVAADLAIAGQFRPSGRPDYGPPAPFALAAGGLLLLLLLLVGLPVLWLVRRVRRRLARPGAPSPGPGLAS